MKQKTIYGWILLTFFFFLPENLSAPDVDEDLR